MAAICRCRGLARGSDEVGAVAQVDEHKVLVCYRVLNRELGLPATTQQPADFVPRLASECSAPEHVERRALELARRCADAGFVNGCQPSGVAGACLYRAAREQGWNITQPEIAERADSTCVTIRARLYDLESLIDE